MAYNKVILMGRLTADPELRRTGNGTPFASFTIAVDRRSKDEQADFPEIVAWKGTAEFVSNNFYKGKEILVDGRLQTRTYEDKDGKKRKAVEVVADEVRFVGKREDAPGRSYQEQDNFSTVEDDDELPFA